MMGWASNSVREKARAPIVLKHGCSHSVPPGVFVFAVPGLRAGVMSFFSLGCAARKTVVVLFKSILHPPKTPNSQRHVKETVETTGDKGRRGAQQQDKATHMKGDKGTRRETKGDKEPRNPATVLRMSASLK